MFVTNVFDGIKMASTVAGAQACSKKIKWEIACSGNNAEGMFFR